MVWPSKAVPRDSQLKGVRRKNKSAPLRGHVPPSGPITTMTLKSQTVPCTLNVFGPGYSPFGCTFLAKVRLKWHVFPPRGTWPNRETTPMALKSRQISSEMPLRFLITVRVLNAFLITDGVINVKKRKSKISAHLNF